MRWTRQRFARDGIAGLVERLVSDHRHADERCCCGRQNRVVLTPRRWRQVRGVASAQPGLDKTYPLMTVAKEPGHRGEHDISRKTIACGNAGRSGVLVVTRVHSTTTKGTRDRGCNGHPAFPTPSMGGGRSMQTSGASRREIARSRLWSGPSLRAKRSNPFFLRGEVDYFAEPVIGRAFARPVGSQ